MSLDAYSTLGVSREATEKEIKTAYQRAASKYHPDKKGGSTTKFQEIQSAYDILSDPIKRQQHDHPNLHDSSNSDFAFHFGGGGPQDIFNQFFNHGFGGDNPFHQPQRPKRNKDLRINVPISLESTLAAQEKTINVQTTNGSKFDVNLSIPRGVTHGTTIRYHQMGDNFFQGLPKGDLYVIINILAPSEVQIHGINVIIPLEITAIEAIVGADKDVTGIDGKIYKVKIQPGTQPGTKLGLAGQGLYQMNTELRGDLVVELRITIPKLSEDQISALNALNLS